MLLRARHLLVPHHREVAALLDRHVGEGDREWADRADDIDLMAELSMCSNCLSRSNHSAQLLRCAPRLRGALIIIAAAVVDVGAGIIRALAQLLEDGTGPPVKMGVDDVHGSVSVPGCIILFVSRRGC